jgi:hypothetical protein
LVDAIIKAAAHFGVNGQHLIPLLGGGGRPGGVSVTELLAMLGVSGALWSTVQSAVVERGIFHVDWSILPVPEVRRTFRV